MNAIALTKSTSHKLRFQAFISLITTTYNRPTQLADIAIISLLAQTNSNFEWIVVNDGANLETRSLIDSLQTTFPLNYLETPRIGLCAARNLGLQAASGDLVCYLDDDNSLNPNFMEEAIAFFENNSTITYSMTRQHRGRNVVEKGQLVKSGQTFTSPTPECQITDLLSMKQLFDSNGFVHCRHHAPIWNPELQVFADYEYLLQCASIWGRSGFQLNPLVLVNYIQTNEGIIGQSNYQQWCEELEYIWKNREAYAVFESLSPDFLLDSIEKYLNKNAARLTAFTQGGVP